jgi:hypothetical protein
VVTTGHEVALCLDLGAAYFFDAGTGLAVPTEEVEALGREERAKVPTAQSL